VAERTVPWRELLAEPEGWRLYRHFEVHDTDTLNYEVIAPDGFKTDVNVHQVEWAGEVESLSAWESGTNPFADDWMFGYYCKTGRWVREETATGVETEITLTEADVHPVLRALWRFVHEYLGRLDVLDPDPPGHGSAFEQVGGEGGD